METSLNDFSADGCRLANDDETAQWLLDDGPVLRTVWTVYDRQFLDGQRELCVTRSTRIRQKGPLPLPPRAKRGESSKRKENDDDSAKRAKQAVRLRCKAISADRMITLTYRENMLDIETVKRHWKEFVRRMSKCKTFHYVATVERQARGAFHLHVAVRGRQSFDLVRSIWQAVVGDRADKKMSQVHVRNPNDFGFGIKGQHRLAAYISKYITKALDDHALNKKRYWTSRGIVVPEKNFYQLP